MIEFRVHRRIERIPEALWDRLEGPKPVPGRFESRDGATLAPDSILYPLWEARDPFREDRRELRFVRASMAGAYVIHDFHYQSHVLGEDSEARLMADRIIGRNVMRCGLFYGAEWEDAEATGRRWYRWLRRGGGWAYRFRKGYRDELFLWRWLQRDPGGELVTAEHAANPYNGPRLFAAG